MGFDLKSTFLTKKKMWKYRSVRMQISHVVLTHLIQGWATFMSIKAPF